MIIIVEGEKVETKDITEIYDIERDKTMFLNREAGFVIKFMDGSSNVFGEKMAYELYPSQIHDIKNKWENLQDKVNHAWEKDKHSYQEFRL